MGTNAELDKWSAEKCGIEISPAAPGLYYRKGMDLSNGRWTLSDARCREIVREYFGISTVKHNSMFECYYDDGTGDFIAVEDKSIEAVEIACIQAIKDAEGR